MTHEKAKVESAVLVVERWILARLRHATFFSLDELNQAIAKLLTELNQRPFKKLPGSRQQWFDELFGCSFARCYWQWVSRTRPVFIRRKY